VVMADYYNAKRKINGGEDAGKALIWYTRAAQNGSPNAMYALGNIYMSGLTGNKAYYVKHNVPKNEALAFEWYLKSIADSEYPASTFHRYTKFGSRIEDGAYAELIKMYRNGTGCEGSEARADELKKRLDD